MKIKLRTALKIGISWEDICKEKGINEHARNEGLIKNNDWIEFSPKFLKNYMDITTKVECISCKEIKNKIKIIMNKINSGLKYKYIYEELKEVIKL